MKPDELTASGAILDLPECRLRLQWAGPRALRLKAWPKTETEPIDRSFCVVAKPDATGCSIGAEGDAVTLSSRHLSLRVTADGDMDLRDGTGRHLLGICGAPAFPRNDLGLKGDGRGVELRVALPADTALYGLGQYQDGVMDWRGRSVRMIHGNTTIVVPFLCSNRGWGLLWDNPSHGEFHDDATGMRLWSEVADGLDCWMVVGDGACGPIAGYRHLTGAAPLPPRWALGYWQSKERYQTGEELASTAEEFRHRNLPLDVIVQDWLWWGTWSDSRKWSGMEVNPVTYGDLTAAVGRCHAVHAKVVISIWPLVGSDTALGRELDAGGHFFTTKTWCGQRCYDAFSPEARAIYAKSLFKGLWPSGVDGWWMDATEPEFRDTHDPLSNKAGALSERPTAAGSWARVLNAFSLVHCGGIHDYQRSVAADRRVLILTRSAWAGQQRYGTAVWSGDIGASWSILAAQIPAGLNCSAAGIPWWTTDCGGFFVRGWGGRHPRGVDDPAYAELYLRWMQFSAMCPLMRSHGTQTPREPWRFGEPGTVWHDGIALMLRLRMRLLPYLDSIASETALSGSTPMRAMGLEFPEDSGCRRLTDQYMLGPSLLVCPVLQPFVHPPSEGLDILMQHDLQDENDVAGALTARFHDGVGLDTERSLRRAHTLDWSWSGSGPDGVTRRDFSVRLDGCLVVPSGGIHGLSVRCDGDLRVWLDGASVCAAIAEPNEVREHRIACSAEAGARIRIRLEYRHQAGDSVLQVGWRRRSAVETTSAAVAMERSVHLPPGVWWDFWTGDCLRGPATMQRPAPLAHLPLLVKGGTILPLGVDRQWTSQHPGAPIELRVHPGSDGETVLHDNDGEGVGWERGERSATPIKWNDHTHTLTIGPRSGTFPGMPKRQGFRVVLIRPGLGGIEPLPADSVVEFTGDKVQVTLPQHLPAKSLPVDCGPTKDQKPF